MTKKPSSLERKFLQLWDCLALSDAPELEREYSFILKADEAARRRFVSANGRPRMWRFDFAWPAYRVAVELEGGVFVGGGHNRGVIYTSNCRKYNAATILGWRVLRFTIKDIEDRPVQMIEEITELLQEGPRGDATEQMRLFPARATAPTTSSR